MKEVSPGRASGIVSQEPFNPTPLGPKKKFCLGYTSWCKSDVKADAVTSQGALYFILLSWSSKKLIESIWGVVPWGVGLVTGSLVSLDPTSPWAAEGLSAEWTRLVFGLELRGHYSNCFESMCISVMVLCYQFLKCSKFMVTINSYSSMWKNKLDIEKYLVHPSVMERIFQNCLP